MKQKSFTEKLEQPLSNRELISYFEKYQNGDESARQILIERNRRLVYFVVNKRFKNNGFLMDDMISVGTIGLMKVVESFDLSKNVTFSTFATTCIIQEILKFINYENRQTRYEFLEDIIYVNKYGNEFTFEDILADDTDTALEYANQEVYKLLRSLLETLPEREKKLIQMYFGLDHQEAKKQIEIAEQMNCTKANVSRIILKGLERLKPELVKHGILEKECLSSKRKKLKK